MKRMVRWMTVTAGLGIALLVGGNGRDPYLWAYFATFAALALYPTISLDPELARERFNPPSPGADRIALRWVRLLAAAHIVVGVFDSRFQWTRVPGPLRAAALAGFALSFLLVMRAMFTNRFFSSVVRIQEERGHHVVDTGPYAFVRHPGYAGMVLFCPLSGLALGSWISAGVALVYSGLVLRRVVFEDRFLRAHLAGYEAYASRVRYLLVPGLW